jgi:Ni,Fe-hydrogenase III large subunit
MKTIIHIRNNEAIALSRIPLLSFADFLEQLAGLMESGAQLLACFVADQPTSMPREHLDLLTIIGCPDSHDLAVLRCRLAPVYPALTCRWPQFHLFEREIAEQYGVIPQDHPWLKPVRFHQVWQGKDVWSRDPDQHPLVGDMEYFQVEGDEIHEVGVGPVHAGIIEPGHFRFQCFGEKVLHLEISLGFQHRGTERLLMGGPHAATPYQMETLAGDTSIGHMLAYSQVMETLGGTKVSQQARHLRRIGLELERLANHVGDFGALAGDVGFLPTASFCGRLRGDYLNMTARICGSRFGRGLVRPGGVLFGVDETMGQGLREFLDTTAAHTDGAVKLFFRSPSVLGRLERTGIVTVKDALKLGITGVAGRACGLDTDCRRLYPDGHEMGTEHPLLCGNEGDVFARAHVRRMELKTATNLIRETLAKLPKADGPVLQTIAPPRPEMLAISLVEGWRGRIAHIALTDARGRFQRYKAIDPSFFNWSGLAMSLRNQQISDFPLCNKSFNLSYCGFDL